MVNFPPGHRKTIMRFCSHRFFALAVIACAALAAAGAGAPVTIERGVIGGARFTAARPAAWNHGLLLLAHGLRSENRPLVADLFPDQLAYKTLLEEGWIIAKTSYRRNGLIIADAMADLDALRIHISETHGTPRRVLLEGESMGGLIVTLLAERDRLDLPLYHGAVAIGAALQLREPNSTAPGISLRPRIPLVFLTNQTELEGPRHYVAADIPGELAVRPVLFRVARDGHVNVNQHERLVALRALNTWLDHGRATLPPPAGDKPFFDATVNPPEKPSQVVLHADQRGFDTRVIEVSAVHGNVFLNAQPADFSAVGIGRMTRFQVTAHGQTYRVVYGRDFTSVKRAQWVAFPNADGFFWLARNFADAAASARLKVGDIVTVRRYEDSGAPPAPQPL